MVCRNFILPEIYKPCLFLRAFQFAKLIVPYPTLDERLSYCETARRFEVSCDTRIKSWERIYLTEGPEGYAILVDEEFSCLEFYMNRDTISWILKKVGCLSEITAYLF